jgi:hypothetical protein
LLIGSKKSVPPHSPQKPRRAFSDDAYHLSPRVSTTSSAPFGVAV